MRTALRSAVIASCGAALFACAKPNPSAWGLLATELPTQMQVLRAGVMGYDCPEAMFEVGDYAEAADKAIRSVPGANALANARFVAQEVVGYRFCVEVHGDAVVLQ